MSAIPNTDADKLHAEIGKDRHLLPDALWEPPS